MTFPIPHLVPLGVGLGWAVVSDLRRRRIPNAVTIAILACGLVLRAVDANAGPNSGNPWLAALSGLAAAVAVVVALHRAWSAGGVGGGDVKLAGAVAAWVGLEKLLWFALATAASGGVVALVCYFAARAPERAEVRSNLTLAMLQGELPTVSGARPGHVTVPYAVAIAVGGVVSLLVAR